MHTSRPKSHPLVSVIIPALNAEDFIGDVIGSALSQSVDDLEVIVVDNGSSDGTASRAGDFDDPRVRVLDGLKPGAAAARNVGIEAASGRYFQFLDADDLLAADKIERQLEEVDQGYRGRAVASAAWLRFEKSPADARLSDERVWPIEDPIEWLISSLSGGGMMQTAAWLTPRELIEAAGPWDESLSLHDDGEYFTRVLLQAERQIFVREAKVYYRTVPDSLSRRRGPDAIESAFKVCRLREHHLLRARDDLTVRAALATQYAQFAYEVSNLAPALARLALGHMRALGARPTNSVGGPGFRKFVAALGFEPALKLRRLLRKPQRQLA